MYSCIYIYMDRANICGGFPEVGACFWWVPIKKMDYGILGSILWSPYLGKLPDTVAGGNLAPP